MRRGAACEFAMTDHLTLPSVLFQMKFRKWAGIVLK